MSNLAHFGLPFGSPWLTFGSHWLPFGSLLAPFGSLLAHFWCPLAHFWCPFLHSCSLRDQSSHFCCILSSFFVYFWINLSCQRQKFRSGPLKGGLEEKIYFLLGCVRCASGKYDLNNREDDFRNLFGLLLEFTLSLSLCLF